MSGFIERADRNQATLFPESLDDYVHQESALRVMDVFVDVFDLGDSASRRKRQRRDGLVVTRR